MFLVAFFLLLNIQLQLTESLPSITKVLDDIQSNYLTSKSAHLYAILGNVLHSSILVFTLIRIKFVSDFDKLTEQKAL